jgi:hypothetical protein
MDRNGGLDLLPLNGTATHELSPIALETLARIAKSPVPAQEVNPGIVNRLVRGDLVELQDRPSPYRTRKGNVPHLVITEAGLAALRAEPE